MTTTTSTRSASDRPGTPPATTSAPARSWKRRRAGGALSVVVLAFLFGASVLWPVSPKGSYAAGDGFSAERAMAHVRVIGQRPHPAGSPAMADVAVYLERELALLGLEVRPLEMRDPRTGILLRVVAGRLPGTHPTGAVLFIAHPDSVPMGPGAGDNATGAATLLETARALTARPPLKNDTIFVFDDGEELGDYPGGELFATHHPWAPDVRLVVGLDTAAWGVPFLMQDSADNGVLVRGYAKAVDKPLAFGVEAGTNRQDAAEIGVFRRRGVPGIELEDTYANVRQHTAGDRVEFVSRSSLQRMGDQVLALATTYGMVDLRYNKAPDRAYFPLPVVGLVHYPAAFAGPLAAATLLLTAAVLVLALRRRVTRPRPLAAGIGAAVVMVAIAIVMGKVAAALYASWQPDPRKGTPSMLGEYVRSSSAPYMVAAVVVIAFAVAALYLAVARRVGHKEVGLGFLVIWTAASVLAYEAAPVGAYVVQWAALAGAAVWLWLVLRPRLGGLALLVPAVVATVILAPQLLLSYFGGGVATLPSAAFATLVIGFVGPAIGCQHGRSRTVREVPGAAKGTRTVVGRATKGRRPVTAAAIGPGRGRRHLRRDESRRSNLRPALDEV